METSGLWLKSLMASMKWNIQKEAWVFSDFLSLFNALLNPNLSVRGPVLSVTLFFLVDVFIGLLHGRLVSCHCPEVWPIQNSGKNHYLNSSIQGNNKSPSPCTLTWSHLVLTELSHHSTDSTSGFSSAFISQAMPIKPSLQTHWPSLQVPWLLQSSTQSWSITANGWLKSGSPLWFAVLKKNWYKAGYTALQVACGWAGAIIKRVTMQ